MKPQLSVLHSALLGLADHIAEFDDILSVELVEGVEQGIEAVIEAGLSPLMAGEPVALEACPAGLFFNGQNLCFKSEYSSDSGAVMAFVVSSGEHFWGGASSSDEQRKVPVIPASRLTLIPLGVRGPVADFCAEVAAEVERAAMLHPGPNPNLAALMEEVGEVSEAMLDARISERRLGQPTQEDWKNIRTEAVQVAAMAFRLAFEGDPTLRVVPE